MAQDILLGNEEQQQLQAAAAAASGSVAGTNSSNSTATASNNDAVTILQQFCLVAKDLQGSALLDLVRQVLETPNVYVFGELFEVPSVEQLKNGPNVKYYNTLNLFAYGTYKLYRQSPNDYIELSSAMQKKLQHLTLVSLAIKQKSIPYEVLLEELEIDNIRDLEDIIIEAIYADIIHGKLFQSSRVLEIDYAQGRDIPPGYAGKIAHTLEEWVNSCNGISTCIDKQIHHANQEKAKRFRNKERIEQELVNLKKLLKSQSDSDEPMQVDSRDNHTGAGSSQEVRKKVNKMKTPRGSSGKLSNLSSSVGLSSSPSISTVFTAEPRNPGGNTASGSSGSSNSTSWYKSLTKSFDKD